ncbi:hypothetical protein ABW21_db0206645 [Orbilia brochopaga]|nr:hypothetical protein ABW21_db0206645 [Drechslerella brochopaga]
MPCKGSSDVCQLLGMDMRQRMIVAFTLTVCLERGEPHIFDDVYHRLRFIPVPVKPGEIVKYSDKFPRSIGHMRYEIDGGMVDVAWAWGSLEGREFFKVPEEVDTESSSVYVGYLDHHIQMCPIYRDHLMIEARKAMGKS